MIIYGKQVVLYILQNYPYLIEEIIFSKQIDKKLFNKFARLKKPIKIIDNKKAQALSKQGNHQGFFLKIKSPKETNIKKLREYEFIIALDNITDVGNIGAIFRTAFVFGVDAIIIGGIKDIKLENIIRTSSGAMLGVDFLVSKNLIDTLNNLQDFKLIGADIDGEDIRNFKYDGKKILILGNENYGISNKIKSKLNYKVSIKHKREFDSLNVSVATGILTFMLG